jgi:hypothetical protein
VLCSRFAEADALFRKTAEDMDTPLVLFTCAMIALVSSRPPVATEESNIAFTVLRDHYVNALSRDPEIEQVIK